MPIQCPVTLVKRGGRNYVRLIDKAPLLIATTTLSLASLGIYQLVMFVAHLAR